MNEVYDANLMRRVLTLLPGEYGASGEEQVFSTLLGSCIAVVIFDATNRVGGMNHFMLPLAARDRKFYQTETGLYGMNAMELVINAVLKRGGERRHFVAKMFGGGSVLRQPVVGSEVPAQNIRFAEEYLAAEGIPLVARNVGGAFARKVYLFARSGRVLLRRIAADRATDLHEREAAYLKAARERGGGGFTLFERRSGE